MKRVRISKIIRANIKKGQPKPPRFKKSQYDNLIYNSCAFQIKGGEVILDRTKGKELKIPLPEQLIGKTIKQVEIIPKTRSFHAVLVRKIKLPIGE